MSHVVFLYAISFVASGCGFVVQMLVSGFWTTAFSHDVLHFSLNVAFYFLSLGIGSLLSEKVRAPDDKTLLSITFALCLWTGVSISFLRLSIVLLGEQPWLPIVMVAIAGILAGAVVPLTVRVGEKVAGMSIPALLGLDYGAAILFNGLFTFVLLVPLGYGKTALFLSFGCFAVATWFLFRLNAWSRLTTTLMLAALLAPLPLYHVSRASTAGAASGDTRVLVNRQSHYQKIVLTEEKGTGAFFPGALQHVLYLDGFVQFSSLDEQTYHACLANIPEAAAEQLGSSVGGPRRALILGGGDGLVARNLLAIHRIEKVTQVELDPAVVELAMSDPRMRALNEDSLKSSRLELVIDDAFSWVRRARGTWDLVIIDFPHPKNLALARLYSAEFYRNVARLTSKDGVIAVQAGPSISPEDPHFGTLTKIPVSVRQTMRAVGLNASIYVSPQDVEAFVLATPRKDFDMQSFATKLGIVGFEGMGLVCQYRSDWREPAVAVNTLNTLPIAGYMLSFYRLVGNAFSYQGVQAAFLPD